jgi:hypothetical protein
MGIFDKGGSQSVSQTITQQQAPYIEDATRRLLSSIQGGDGIAGIIDTPYENYNELAAAGAVTPRLAGFSPDQIQAMDLARQGVGSYQPYLDAATQTATQVPQAGIDMMSQGTQYGPLDRYMNPYIQNVIDPTMAEMLRQQEMQQDKLDAQAAAARAYGGSRHGVAEAEMEKGHDMNRALMASQLYHQGYTTAQAAQEAHRNRQLQGGANIGNLGLDTARVQSGLGQLGQQMNLQDVSALGTTGGAQQQQLQKQYDINYNQWLDEYQDPFRRAAFTSDIIRGVPSSQSVQTAGVAPQPSQLSQGIGALGQFATMGQQFGWWGNPSNPTTTGG